MTYQLMRDQNLRLLSHRQQFVNQARNTQTKYGMSTPPAVRFFAARQHRCLCRQSV